MVGLLALPCDLSPLERLPGPWLSSSARWWHRTARVHAGVEPQGSQAGFHNSQSTKRRDGAPKLHPLVWCQLISVTHSTSKHSLLCLPRRGSVHPFFRSPASLGANVGTIRGDERPQVAPHTHPTQLWALRWSCCCTAV